MKYQEKSITINAYKIVETKAGSDGKTSLVLNNGEVVIAGEGALAGISPDVGDYWVVKSDGYAFWAQKETFENKYDAVDSPNRVTSSMPISIRSIFKRK